MAKVKAYFSANIYNTQ